MLCDTCKIGAKHMKNINDLKKKVINRREFLAKEKSLGSICTICIHNTIGKRKSKVIKKMYPSFKSIDMYQKMEE